MKVKLLKPTYISGKLKNAGDVIDTPRVLGRELIWGRKAELVKDEPILDGKGEPKPLDKMDEPKAEEAKKEPKAKAKAKEDF